MRIDQAKSIQLIDLLETLGYKPVKTTNAGNQAWYCSPLRAEKEPSFTVKISDNCWIDFGGEGGNILDFVMQYRNTDLRGALAFLDSLHIIPASATIRQVRKVNNDNSIIIQKVQPLQYDVLLNQLAQKAIPADIAKLYLQEIYYLNGGKRYFGYGMKNDRGGYEIHNQFFKGATLKSPTTLKGQDTTRVTIFEGMTDFLSALLYYKQMAFQTDVIILHSRAFGKQVIKNIQESQQYKTIFLYLDNDSSGEETTTAFINTLHPTIDVKPMNAFYKEYKDVNDFWKAQYYQTNR